jgi:hypothetical protein
MSVSNRLNPDDASYIVALATPEASRTRTLDEIPGKGFVKALKGFFGEVPVQMFLDKHFKGVDAATLAGGKKKVYDAVFDNADLSVANQLKFVRDIIAQMPIGKEYVQNIPYAQSKHLIPVAGGKFYTALELTYGTKAVQKANEQIFGMSDSAYSGVKEFKARVVDAISTDAPLSVDDQKYIQDRVQFFA